MSTCTSGLPRSSGLQLRWSFWLRSGRRRLRSRRSPCLRRNDVDGFGVRIEHDPGFSAFELTVHMSQLLLQRELPLTVVRALAKHKGLHNATQRVGRKLRMGNEQRFLGFITTVNWRQFLSI